MKSFMSMKYASLKPYVPGEQPLSVNELIKLNTNESPFPPHEGVVRAAGDAAKRLNLYCDARARELCEAYAALIGVSPDEVLPTNGSDEILYWAFLAYGDSDNPMAFPDITYGFYPVYASLLGVPARVVPLKDDMSVNVDDYIGIRAHTVLANPNAPTSVAITKDEIERLARANPGHMLIVDEAYVDYGGESCVSLIRKYENLLITHTFSKSRSLAGGRLGFGVGCAARIAELNAIKYSINPYNVSSLTQAAGLAAIEANDYYMAKAAEICEIRDDCAEKLRDLGFNVLKSSANFLFLSYGANDARPLCEALRARGILVRHFVGPRTLPYIRMSIGTRGQMNTVLEAIRAILREG